MKKFRLIIIIANLLLLMVYFNYSIVRKENILAHGKIILLKLAPVDPRSLMQGDYMQLNYDIAANSPIEKISKRGYCVVKTDSNSIANFIRFQPEKSNLKPGEYQIEYSRQNGRVSIGHESYFFQEGKAKKYVNAKYGGLKIDENGNSILIGLYDDNFRLIK